MRSVVDRLRIACVVMALAASPMAIAQESGATISRAEIQKAMEVVRNDPNLVAERKTKTLRWVPGPEKKPRANAGWMEWLANLFKWFAQSGRFLFWGVLIVLAAMLVIYLVRLLGGWRMPERAQRLEVPSFVRDLDIRPESLPEDIGAAARALWDAGDHRAALSLLYRGLLSRLVHVHGVPIKDSTTEGDCLALAGSHLVAESRKRYVVRLIRVWQRAVYGGEQVPDDDVRALCADFAGALDNPDAVGVPS